MKTPGQVNYEAMFPETSKLKPLTWESIDAGLRADWERAAKAVLEADRQRRMLRVEWPQPNEDEST